MIKNEIVNIGEQKSLKTNFIFENYKGDKMTKCVYCSTNLTDNRSMEICDRCGVMVWGHKMWAAIRKTTDDARDNGDLALYKDQENTPKLKDVVGKVA
jgi:uncharacterized UBP type Zn finger protein